MEVPSQSDHYHWTSRKEQSLSTGPPLSTRWQLPLQQDCNHRVATWWVYLDSFSLRQCCSTIAVIVIFLLNCNSDLKSLTNFKPAQLCNLQYESQLPKSKRRFYQWIYLSGWKQKLNLCSFPPQFPLAEKKQIFFDIIFFTLHNWRKIC